MQCWLQNNNIVAMPPATNGIMPFIRFLLLFPGEMPLSRGTNLCSCLSFPSSAHSAFVSLTCGPCCYLIWQCLARSWSITLPRWQTAGLPLIVCSYICILEFLLSCFCVVLSVSCVSMSPRLARSISLGLHADELVLVVLMFWACAMRTWHRLDNCDNHVFCTHAHCVQPCMIDDTRTHSRIHFCQMIKCGAHSHSPPFNYFKSLNYIGRSL